MSKNSTDDLTFPNEKAEADWYHSPEGRARSLRTLTKAVRDRKVVLRDGSQMKLTDRAAIEQLLAEARAAATQAISLRLPASDIEAAKRLAEDTGKGYQTILKEIIHKGLTNPGARARKTKTAAG
ncbi:MAG TPA: hypothetical protein VK604_27260 [Bryobacteraceae bacterium]|nr:hypothetical protein [Bryobacteraceae bacterium]